MENEVEPNEDESYLPAISIAFFILLFINIFVEGVVFLDGSGDESELELAEVDGGWGRRRLKGSFPDLL